MTYDGKSAHGTKEERRKSAPGFPPVQANSQAEIARLTSDLADARDQARAAGVALAGSAEDAASLRRAKESAEAAALVEFRLRLHMEQELLLADSKEKSLQATIKSLRDEIDTLKADQNAAEALKMGIARGLERERAAQFQIAALHESLEAARDSIATLTAQCDALQRQPQERKRFFFEKKNQKTFTPLS